MASTLPYLASPGSLKTCLDKIKTAATPERVTSDFMSTLIGIKGGTGRALIPFLKKMGFVAPDGSPTDLYKRFRNHSSAGVAAAVAVKSVYKELTSANEYFFELGDKDLLALINQVSGAAEGDKVAKLTLSTLKSLRSYADFKTKESGESERSSDDDGDVESDSKTRQSGGASSAENFGGKLPGLNLTYTINLNLPATSDQAVFNAIFRSLRENLLSAED